MSLQALSVCYISLNGQICNCLNKHEHRSTLKWNLPTQTHTCLLEGLGTQHCHNVCFLNSLLPPKRAQVPCVVRFLTPSHEHRLAACSSVSGAMSRKGSASSSRMEVPRSKRCSKVGMPKTSWLDGEPFWGKVDVG